MEDILVCLGFLGFFILLFSFILLLRYLNYRETVALADRGLVKPRRERNGGGKGVLVWGILIAALGLALMLGLWPIGFSSVGMDYPLGFGPWMLLGLVPLFFGLALVLIYVLIGGEKKTVEEKTQDLPTQNGSEFQPLTASETAVNPSDFELPEPAAENEPKTP